jgi:hypothetical protein
MYAVAAARVSPAESSRTARAAHAFAPSKPSGAAAIANRGTAVLISSDLQQSLCQRKQTASVGSRDVNRDVDIRHIDRVDERPLGEHSGNESTSTCPAGVGGARVCWVCGWERSVAPGAAGRNTTAQLAVAATPTVRRAQQRTPHRRPRSPSLSRSLSLYASREI